MDRLFQALCRFCLQGNTAILFFGKSQILVRSKLSRAERKVSVLTPGIVQMHGTKVRLVLALFYIIYGSSWVPRLMLHPMHQREDGLAAAQGGQPVAGNKHRAPSFEDSP